ncbi:SDR family NAD(P)-dependent oxidoreductase [Priestia flexa]|uniref:SDR family NAD(P)-dependent oxidoreductase n=1 Tax=Priestia flexa TaxID=86664 RepID=UPI000C233375|nr:SDR family NAD(P)-dependent oxidoreductase [Priestia flexa]MEC0665835.1 SDR family NAD(P)-dependent oxidoreductase [Priestia flexa]
MRRAVITGASGVIGQHVYTFLKKQGFDVYSIGRTPPTTCSNSEKHFTCNFTKVSEVEKLKRQLRLLTGVEVIVLGAGIDSYQNIHSFSEIIFEKVMRINCMVHLEIIQALTSVKNNPYLKLFVLSSDVLSNLVPDSLVYAVSKAALEEGVRNLCTENDNVLKEVYCFRLPYIGVPMSEIAEMKNSPASLEPESNFNANVLNKLIFQFERALEKPKDLNSFAIIEI